MAPLCALVTRALLYATAAVCLSMGTRLSRLFNLAVGHWFILGGVMGAVLSGAIDSDHAVSVLWFFPVLALVAGWTWLIPRHYSGFLLNPAYYATGSLGLSALLQAYLEKIWGEGVALRDAELPNPGLSGFYPDAILGAAIAFGIAAGTAYIVSGRIRITARMRWALLGGGWGERLGYSPRQFLRMFLLLEIPILMFCGYLLSHDHRGSLALAPHITVVALLCVLGGSGSMVGCAILGLLAGLFEFSVQRWFGSILTHSTALSIGLLGITVLAIQWFKPQTSSSVFGGAPCRFPLHRLRWEPGKTKLDRSMPIFIVCAMAIHILTPAWMNCASLARVLFFAIIACISGISELALGLATPCWLPFASLCVYLYAGVASPERLALGPVTGFATSLIGLVALATLLPKLRSLSEANSLLVGLSVVTFLNESFSGFAFFDGSNSILPLPLPSWLARSSAEKIGLFGLLIMILLIFLGLTRRWHRWISYSAMFREPIYGVLMGTQVGKRIRYRGLVLVGLVALSALLISFTQGGISASRSSLWYSFLVFLAGSLGARLSFGAPIALFMLIIWVFEDFLGWWPVASIAASGVLLVISGWYGARSRE